MEKELGGPASSQARPSASSSTTNIAYSLANENANCGKTYGKSAVREGKNPEPVQLSLDLESVTRASVVEPPVPVVESLPPYIHETKYQNADTLQQPLGTSQCVLNKRDRPPILDRSANEYRLGAASLDTTGIPYQTPPGAKMNKNIEGKMAPKNGKGWLAWHYKIRDCSGKQHSHSCSAGEQIPDEASGPYAIYCWHVPGKANGRKYVGKAGGKKYNRFIEVWNQCDSWPRVLSLAFGV
ncbi:MAG: hypothetical protein F6J93_19885 [Oscillatoria sp. SIO1A7]|nr:hypothetical protein [Oscillatoria sp. SIO1A7]